jgi:hypothetical protein
LNGKTISVSGSPTAAQCRRPRSGLFYYFAGRESPGPSSFDGNASL